MLRVASPAALPSPRDAAAPYRMKTRLATQTARAGNAGAQLPHRPSVYRELSDSEDVSDAPSTPPRRKRKARTPAVKHRPSARPALPPPAAAPRPDPAAAPATWVEDEVSQWHGRIFGLLDNYNAKQRHCLHEHPAWPSLAASCSDDAEARARAHAPHDPAPPAAPTPQLYAVPGHDAPVHVPRARGAPISALLLSPEEERRLAPPPSWQPPDFSSYRFPDPRQERSFEPLPRPFETLTRPFEPAPPRARPPSPVPAHPVWLWSEADRDPSRSRSGSSSTSSTLIPTPPTPHKARPARCWACTTMDVGFCKAHQ